MNSPSSKKGMQPGLVTRSFRFDAPDEQRLIELHGPLNEHITQIESRLDIRIASHGGKFTLTGNDEGKVRLGEQILRELYSETEKDALLDVDEVHLFIQEKTASLPGKKGAGARLQIKTPKLMVRPRGENQQKYVETIRSHDINFGIGPAGTGKTFLAVACAVEALENSEVSRILLIRPAVEAGEKLGFLPGDLAQKIDPYLRPLYDALYEMLGFERVGKLIERNIIEVAPLAYMRGRTLNHSFIILDESQNTTVEQMKMFLTRIGFGSTAVITGDATQVDLPRGVRSGLRHADEVLSGVSGIGRTHFTSHDVVRHPLVQRIVEAYQDHEKKHSDG